MKKYIVILVTLLCATVSLAQKSKSQTDSLRYKVGQMIICGFMGDKIEPYHKTLLQEYHIGGVILFDKNVANNYGARNIINSRQLKRFVTELKNSSSDKLIVSIDQEGGRVARLTPKRGFIPSLSAKEIGELDNLDSTKYYTEQQAKQLQELGINLNFAPCVDLSINPRNPIIAKVERAYGDNPDEVVKQATVIVEQYSRYGILTSLKHFPGHGSSIEDSHLGLPDITDVYQDKEIEPYRQMIKEGYDQMVMVGHLVNRDVDTLPASLSKRYIQGVLRDELNFKGVVVTDDLNMGAIIDNFGHTETLKLAINAGVDMIIIGDNATKQIPNLTKKTIDTIIELVNNGEIETQRINQAYHRVLKLKERIK